MDIGARFTSIQGISNILNASISSGTMKMKIHEILAPVTILRFVKFTNFTQPIFDDRDIIEITCRVRYVPAKFLGVGSLGGQLVYQVNDKCITWFETNGGANWAIIVGRSISFIIERPTIIDRNGNIQQTILGDKLGGLIVDNRSSLGRLEP